MASRNWYTHSTTWRSRGARLSSPCVSVTLVDDGFFFMVVSTLVPPVKYAGEGGDGMRVACIVRQHRPRGGGARSCRAFSLDRRAASCVASVITCSIAAITSSGSCIWMPWPLLGVKTCAPLENWLMKAAWRWRLSLMTSGVSWKKSEPARACTEVISTAGTSGSAGMAGNVPASRIAWIVCSSPCHLGGMLDASICWSCRTRAASMPLRTDSKPSSAGSTNTMPATCCGWVAAK